MLRTAEQIIADIKIVADEHESRLSSLIDEAETMLLSPTLAVERRIARRLQGLLPQFTQGKVGEDFRILNNSENVDLAARIYSVVQSDLQPFSDEATKWAIDSLSDAYTMGVKATVDEYNAGADDDMGFTFSEQDAMVMEIALTKGYGKEQRGIGKIKDITQETADSIRDIMLRGIYEQKTTTQLMAELYSPDVGLTSLEIFDSQGRRRTLSVRQRAKLIARNEIAAIYQVAAVEKAREIFDADDTYWLYGSVYEKERISDYCRKRFGRVAKVSQWHDTSWVRQEFGDMRTGTGHIHVNCRNAGMAISPDWFAKTTWVTLVTQEMHIITGQDYRDYISDPDKKIPTSKITHGD